MTDGRIDIPIDRVENILQAYNRKKPIVLIDVDKCLEVEKQKIVENINECKINKNFKLQREIIKKAQKFNIMSKIFNAKEVINEQMLEEELNKIDKSQDNLRIRMEWFYRDESLEPLFEVDKECAYFGMDFNQEMQKARERIDFKDRMDKYVNLSEKEKEDIFGEMERELLFCDAKLLNLNFESELDLAQRRNNLRNQIKEYFSDVNKSSLTIDEFNKECISLGLNFNYEIDNIRKQDNNKTIQETIEITDEIAKIFANDKNTAMKKESCRQTITYLEIEQEHNKNVQILE